MRALYIESTPAQNGTIYRQNNMQITRRRGRNDNTYFDRMQCPSPTGSDVMQNYSSQLNRLTGKDSQLLKDYDNDTCPRNSKTFDKMYYCQFQVSNKLQIHLLKLEI